MRATVFVIDDDEAVRDSIAALGAAIGLQVRGYASGEEFLSAIEEDLRGCLVVDVRLPGMGGLEFQATLAQSGIDLPVIVITGHGDDTTCETAMSRGAVDFLEKPFQPEVLLRSIRRALELDAKRSDAAIDS